MIQLFFAAKWILISEVTFESGEFQLFTSQDICVKVPSPSSQTGHCKKVLQKNLHRSVSRKSLASGSRQMKWETHDEKCLTMFTLLLLSGAQQHRYEDKRLLHHHPQCPVPPSKVSPTQRVKLLSDKTEAFVQKIESHKRRLPSSTECRPLKNLGIQ